MEGPLVNGLDEWRVLRVNGPMSGGSPGRWTDEWRVPRSMDSMNGVPWVNGLDGGSGSMDSMNGVLRVNGLDDGGSQGRWTR